MHIYNVASGKIGAGSGGAQQIFCRVCVLPANMLANTSLYFYCLNHVNDVIILVYFLATYITFEYYLQSSTTYVCV